MYRPVVPLVPDHLLAIVLAVLFPVRAAFFGYRRLVDADPGEVPRVRLWLYRQGIAIQWTLTGLTLALWVWQRRPWAALGVVPQLNGGFIGVLIGLAIVVGYIAHQRKKALRDEEALARLRRQMRNVERMLPRSVEELRWFARLAVTAGICEELLYRGYLIWYLNAWMSWIPAALVASVVFGIGHAYQGPRGIALTALVGIFLSAVYWVSGSILACIVIHALMDLYAGHAAYTAFGHGETGSSLPPPTEVEGDGAAAS